MIDHVIKHFDFRHKKLGMTTSVSTVFSQIETIKPPPAFRDPHQLPPGAIILPSNTIKQKGSINSHCSRKLSLNNDSVVPSSGRSTYRSSNFSCSTAKLDDMMTPREREINSRYPIYDIDLHGCYP